MSKRHLLFAACGLTALVLGIHEWTLLPDGNTHLYFLDVGQGDGAMVVTPSGKQVVIDGGPDWKILEGIADRMPLFDRSIDLLVLSHAHADHSVGLAEILRRYKVGTLVVSSVELDSAREREFRETAKMEGVPVRAVAAGDTIELGDGLAFDVLWPYRDLPKAFTSDLNNVSVVLRLRDGAHSALFAGDAEKIVEDTLVKAGADIHSEILKVGHHGSKTSSSTGFLLAVDPEVAVVSVGTGNSFGHPNADVIARLQGFGATVRRTDTEGTVEIEWER
jgi:competence protein ComEC